MFRPKLKRLAFLLLSSSLSASAESSPPPFVGSYEGLVPDAPKGYWASHPPLAARVIGLGDDQYEVQLLPELHKRAPHYLSAKVEATGDRLTLEQGKWKITFDGSKAIGAIKTNDTSVDFILPKTDSFSPTLGKEPPPGAIILFNGKDLSQWQHQNTKENPKPVWRITEDGAMEIQPRTRENRKGGDLITKETFSDCHLHLEFRLPYLPSERGQSRGNSGLFFQGTYEIQILDSFGLSGAWDECGALYRVAPPKVNAAAAPGQWQTYDIEFTAARFDDTGSLISPPVITVRHNGILIHNQTEITEITAFQHSDRQSEHRQWPGPIRLQDHGSAVQFRNIWVQTSTP